MTDQIQHYYGVGIKKMRDFIQAINADLKVAIDISKSGLI